MWEAEADEMVESVKFLPCEHKDLSSNLRSNIKRPTKVFASLQSRCWGCRDRQVSRASSLASLAESVSSRIEVLPSLRQ